jgi:hypothetical protein
MVSITSVNSHVQLKLESADGEPLAAGARVLDAGSRVAEAVEAGSLWVKEYRWAARSAGAPRRGRRSGVALGAAVHAAPGRGLPRLGNRPSRRAAGMGRLPAGAPRHHPIARPLAGRTPDAGAQCIRRDLAPRRSGRDGSPAGGPATDAGQAR